GLPHEGSGRAEARWRDGGGAHRELPLRLTLVRGRSRQRLLTAAPFGITMSSLVPGFLSGPFDATTTSSSLQEMVNGWPQGSSVLWPESSCLSCTSWLMVGQTPYSLLDSCHCWTAVRTTRAPVPAAVIWLSLYLGRAKTVTLPATMAMMATTMSTSTRVTPRAKRRLLREARRCCSSARKIDGAR